MRRPPPVLCLGVSFAVLGLWPTVAADDLYPKAAPKNEAPPTVKTDGFDDVTAYIRSLSCEHDIRRCSLIALAVAVFAAGAYVLRDHSANEPKKADDAAGSFRGQVQNDADRMHAITSERQQNQW